VSNKVFIDTYNEDLIVRRILPEVDCLGFIWRLNNWLEPAVYVNNKYTILGNKNCVCPCLRMFSNLDFEKCTYIYVLAETAFLYLKTF